MRAEIAGPLERALADLAALGLGDAFDARAARAIVEAGLHRLCVPASAGGLEASMAEAAEVLLAIGALDGATALGFAMQVHVTGALRDAPFATDAAPEAIRTGLFDAIVRDGALVNNASTEEGGGSPARGAIPGTTASGSAAVGPDAAGWRLTGEKTWTTWLPNLTHAFVSARLVTDSDGPPAAEDAPPEVGTFLVDLTSPGVERREGFEALGMRGSASGRLGLEDAAGVMVAHRPAGSPDPRGAAPGAWFAIAVAATYLGVGEGARADVIRWAVDRRPGDGRTAVAELPTVQLRLGRLDAALRTARIVVLDAAERWDQARAAGDEAGASTAAADLTLAKLVATQAAVTATDEALRIAGGPGFLAGRLERAFRDARAGLINPPLEDVALTGLGRALVEDRR